MIKEKRILSYAVGYLLVGLFICMIGISNVFAATYNATQFTAQLYDNYGPSLSSVTTDFTNNRYQGIIPTMVANSSGAAWGISSPVTLVANHTYTLTAEISGTYGGRLVLSTYNRIGVGTSLSNAKSSYQNNSYVKEIYSKVQDNGYTIQFAFTPTINASYIVFPFSTNYSGDVQSFYLENIVIDDLGSESITEEQITNSLNAQTNEINSTINNMGEEISGTIEDNFNNCKDSVSIENLVNGSISGVDGSETATSDTRLRTNSYIFLNNNKSYTLSLDSDSNIQIFIFEYDKGKNFIQRIPVTWAQVPYTFTTDSNTSYIKIVFGKSDNSNINVNELSNIKLTGKICTNKIDETNDKLDETNNQLGDLNDSLNDSNVDGSIGSAGSFFDNFTTTDHGGLSGIITAPLEAINQMLNTSCSPMTATFKGKELSLPCGYEFWERLGAIQDFINIVLGGMLCYRIIIKLYKLIERIKNPEDDRLEVMDL